MANPFPGLVMNDFFQKLGKIVDFVAHVQVQIEILLYENHQSIFDPNPLKIKPKVRYFQIQICSHCSLVITLH